jgi:hypothetical protein
MQLTIRSANVIRLVFACLLAVCSAGCATNVTGPYQEVHVTSEPPGLMVKSDSGQSIVTPGTFSLERNKKHILSAECPGFETKTIELKSGIQGWFWGNAILGGAVGGVWDMQSGSAGELKPNKVHFIFK